MKRKRSDNSSAAFEELFDFSLVKEKKIDIETAAPQNHLPSTNLIKLTDLPPEIISSIANFLLNIRDGMAFTSTCPHVRDCLLDHHDLFIEFRLDRELKALKRREESKTTFHMNRKIIGKLGSTLSNISNIVEVKEMWNSKKENWTKFTNQYREPYRRAIWKFILNRVRYHDSTSSSIIVENTHLSYYIDDVLIRCIPPSSPQYSEEWSLYAFHNDLSMELLSHYHSPNADAVHKFKEIIGITREGVGGNKDIYKMFSTHTILNILIIAIPDPQYSSTTQLFDEYYGDSSDDDEDISPQFHYNEEEEEDDHYFDDEANYEDCNQ